MKLKALFLVVLGFALTSTANAALIVVDDFTGADTQMNVNITNRLGDGVSVDLGFTAESANTGDITGVWLGLDDSLFDPANIDVSDIVITSLLPAGVSYSVAISDSINLGGGVNLTGENGYIFQFDLDLSLVQNDLQQNDIIDSLAFDIITAGLDESYFDSAGVRLQSVGPNGQDSAKLAGSIVLIPEPGIISLLGAGLIGLGFARRKTKK